MTIEEIIFQERGSDPRSFTERSLGKPLPNTDMNVKLRGENLPKSIVKAGKVLLGARDARDDAVQKREECDTALKNARITTHHAETMALAAGEGVPEDGDDLLDELERRAIKWERRAKAAIEAVPITYGAFLSTVLAERAAWTPTLKVEADKALMRIATLTRQVETAAAELEASLGVLGMYAKIDSDEAEGHTPKAAIARGPHSAAIEIALANLHEVTGRASAYLREV